MRAYFGLILAGAVYVSTGSAHAQSIHPVDVDGKTINLVVPEGYCGIDTARADERQIFRTLQSVLGEGSKLLLVYFECEALGRFRDDLADSPRLNKRGIYYVLVDERGVAIALENQERAEFAESFSRKLPDIDIEAARLDALARTKEILNDPNADVSIEYFGSNGFSNDAAFFSAAGVETNLGDTYPIFISGATTLINDRMVTLTRSDATDSAEAIEQLDRDIRTLMLMLIDANPDSDN